MQFLAKKTDERNRARKKCSTLPIWQTEAGGAGSKALWAMPINGNNTFQKGPSLREAFIQEKCHFLSSKHLKGQLWHRVGDKKWALSHSVSWWSVMTARGWRKMSTFSIQRDRPRSAARRAAQDLVLQIRHHSNLKRKRNNKRDDEVDGVNDDGNTANVRHHWAQSQDEKPLKIHLVAWGFVIKFIFYKEIRSNHSKEIKFQNIIRIRNNKKYNLENDQSPQTWHPCAFSFGSIDVHQLLHAGNKGLTVLNDHHCHFDHHHHLDHHHHYLCHL